MFHQGRDRTLMDVIHQYNTNPYRRGSVLIHDDEEEENAVFFILFIRLHRRNRSYSDARLYLLLI